MKIILISILLISGIAKAHESYPAKISNFPVIYLDYKEDEPFKFNKTRASHSEMDRSIETISGEIEGAFDDKNSLLGQVMANEGAKVIFIQIDESQMEDNPYECPPDFIDNKGKYSCGLSAYIHFYKDRICTSTKEELIKLAADELRNPTCVKDSRDPDEKRVNRKLLMLRLLFGGQINSVTP